MDALVDGLANAFWYLVILLFSAAVYWYGFGRFRAIKKLGLPGPKPMPFIGHLYDFAKANFQLHLFFDKYVRDHGDCFGILFLGNPTLVVSDPEMLKQILVKDFTKFHDRNFLPDLPEPICSALTIVTGERWKFIRSTLTPSFSSGKMRPMAGILMDLSETMLSKCRQSIKMGQSIDFVSLHKGFTMEAILAVAFGTKAYSQTDPNDEITAKAMKAIGQPKWLSVISLIPGGTKLMKYLPNGFDSLMNPILDVARHIINQRRKVGFHKDKKDFLQLMLDAQDEPNKEGRRLTDNEVIAQALVFLLAGFETTSTTLALVCYHLARYRDVQNALYEELKEKLDDEQTSPDYDIVQQLEYLDMVISETLRLYPPGFFIIRTCNEDCKVKGVQFRRGFSVVVPVYSIHRNEKTWEEPERFDPDRFKTEVKAKRDPFTFLPFGFGPRSCIGMRFAQMEMKIVLAKLIKEFQLEICEETTIPPKVVAGGVLRAIDPIKLRVIPRNSSSAK